jgi:hypothetical protein
MYLSYCKFVSHETYKRTPAAMRMKIDCRPMFPLTNIDTSLKIVCEYQAKLERISDVLDRNAAILQTVHNDLAAMGSDEGRESTYSSEQMLRALIVKTLEGLSLRDAIVRISDSPILRNFTRIFSGKVMNFTVLDATFKMIQPQSWKKVNELLGQCARKKKRIRGKKLRVDSTVCESNIHYPTDASLLWDSYRTIARLVAQCREENRGLDTGIRFHEKKLKRLFTFIATHSSKKNRSTKRKVRALTGVLIERVKAAARKQKSAASTGIFLSCCRHSAPDAKVQFQP